MFSIIGKLIYGDFHAPLLTYTQTLFNVWRKLCCLEFIQCFVDFIDSDKGEIIILCWLLGGCFCLAAYQPYGFFNAEI